MSGDTGVAPDAIDHLDFRSEETSGCEGWTICGERHNCHNAAKVAAVRTCCGVIDSLCFGCYNEICAFHVSQPDGDGGMHSRHLVGSRRAYSMVEFL